LHLVWSGWENNSLSRPEATNEAEVIVWSFGFGGW
jgi:hypothetical protein